MKKIVSFILITALVIYGNISAQEFNFDAIEKQVNSTSCIIDMKIEYSFGIHTNEQEDKYLGTVVSEDGLVVFNGTMLSSEAMLQSFTGFNVKTTPLEIEITFLNGDKYSAEYIGVDRFTKIGFLKIDAEDKKFDYVSFKKTPALKRGDWLAIYALLPDYVDPPLYTDIGMVSAQIKSPEEFTLMVGFNMSEMMSVIYDQNGQPIGLLGRLANPAENSFDGAAAMESMSQFAFPLLGLIPAEKINELIANPPKKGSVDRGWLGITLQALTPEMASFWGLDIKAGIIVNDIVNNSPAQEGGLEVGDIIYEVNGLPVEVDKDEKISIFQRRISELGPDAQVEFSVYRPGEDNKTFEDLKMITTLQKAPMTATDAPEYENELLEFKVRELVFADYLFLNKDEETFNGVIVAEIKQGGLADVEGLQIGDVIQSINSEPVGSIEDAETILNQLEEEKIKEIIFFVWRDQKTMFVNIKTD